MCHFAIESWQLSLSPTCSVPAESHGLSLRPGRNLQGEDADHDAAEVRQKMSRVRHDGQTVSRVSA